MENLNTQKVLCFFEGIILLIGIKSLFSAIGIEWLNMSITEPAYSGGASLAVAWILDITSFFIGIILIVRAVRSSFWLGYAVDILILIMCVGVSLLYAEFMVMFSAAFIALGACLDMYRIYSAVGFNDGLGYLWRKYNFLK